jgi:hypothetical protein
MSVVRLYDFEVPDGSSHPHTEGDFSGTCPSYPTIMPKTRSKTSENPDFCPLFRVFLVKSQEFGPFSRFRRRFPRWPILDSYLLVTRLEAHQVPAGR